MSDQWKGMGGDLLSYGRRGVIITPGGTDLAEIPKAVVVTAAGDATVIPQNNADNATIPFTGLSAGSTLPFIIRRVTTATATLVAVYD